VEALRGVCSDIVGEEDGNTHTSARVAGVALSGQMQDVCLVKGWGLHSSTFQLNLSAFCGIGRACRGCLGGV